MTKLLFLHYFKFTKEFREKWNELQPAEWKRYNYLLKDHGLKMLNHGVPFGSEYHWVGIIESEKGKIAISGTPQSIIENQTFYDIYMGDEK